MESTPDAIWEAKAEAAELIADESSVLYSAIGYYEAEMVRDWCHAWAAQFRAHTENFPEIPVAIR